MTTFAVSTRVPGRWRWFLVVVGLLAVAAGIATFVWPDITLYVISVFLA